MRRLTLVDGCISPKADEAAGCCSAIGNVIGQLEELNLSGNYLFASGSRALAGAISSLGPARSNALLRSPSNSSRQIPLRHLSVSDANLCGISMPGVIAHDQEGAAALLKVSH